LIRAISILIISIVFTPKVFATNEYWGIYQFKSDLYKDHFIFTEYVRRDKENYFKDKNLDLIRLSIGGKWKTWTYMLGLAHVDFENGAEELRFHQFLIKNIKFNNQTESLIRLALEERKFEDDSYLYLRGRARMQFNVPVYKQWGLAFYEEILLALNGSQKFSTGLNENRLGAGIRYKSSHFEVMLYKTLGYIKTLKGESEPNWIQLQTIYSF